MPQVFTRALAPLGPLSRLGTTEIVRTALRRIGIKSPINGAHVLRHSAAAAMLQQGMSLAGIGAALRHRFSDTAARYTKVDWPATITTSGAPQPRHSLHLWV